MGAECYYNSLLQRCAAPSTECKQFLKTYACVSTFPQCDANGYDDDLSAVLFSTLDTPSFDTIVATIPPIVNDDDDDKLFVNNEVTIPANDTSDSSAIAFSAFFLLFVVFLI